METVTLELSKDLAETLQDKGLLEQEALAAFLEEALAGHEAMEDEEERR